MYVAINWGGEVVRTLKQACCGKWQPWLASYDTWCLFQGALKETSTASVMAGLV